MRKMMKGNVISASNATLGWLKATDHVLSNGGKDFNIIVQIEKPAKIDDRIHNAFDRLCDTYDVPKPQTAANTIFPESVYKRHPRKKAFYEHYSANYKRYRRGRWGTYFGRMTKWPFTSDGRLVNQLDEIIKTINSRSNVFATAYTIQIRSPEKNFCQPRGAPCLESVLLQLEKQTNHLNMLAVYRNHDFISKAYGNYIGLGRLMSFLCKHTRFSLGVLTCVSSHAFITSLIPRKELKNFVQSNQ